MKAIPEHLNLQVHRRIRRDIDPPLTLVFLKVVVATVVGGLMTALLCGRFSGDGGLSIEHLMHRVDIAYADIWCAALCGSIFAILPVVVLRLITSSVQFLTIFAKHKLLLGINLSGAAAVFFVHEQVSSYALGFVVWTAGALVAGLLIAKIIKLLDRTAVPQSLY